MNYLYIQNYAILASFLFFFLLEVGIALIALFDFKSYSEKLKGYLLALWEIDSTFAIFYIVNLEATYPKALTLIGTVYAVPLLAAGFFLIARNAFLAYSELSHMPKDEKGFLTLYSGSTLIIAFIVIMTFSSGVTGAGVNAHTSALEILPMFAQPFGIIMFIAAVFLALSATALCFDIRRMRNASLLFLLLSIVLALLGSYMYTSILANAQHDLYAVVAAAIMVSIIYASALKLSGYVKYFVVPFFMALIVLFGMLQYPYLLGGSATYTGLMTGTAAGLELVLFTTAGTIMLALSMAILFYLLRKR